MTAVLPAAALEGSRLSPDPLRYAIPRRYLLESSCVPSKLPLHEEYSPSNCPSSLSSSPSSSPLHYPTLTPTPPEDYSYTPTTISSLSLNADYEHEHEHEHQREDEDEIVFPSYDSQRWSNDELKELHDENEMSTDSSATLNSLAADDTSIEVEPSRHVDYLSHLWKEEDIWASWRYVTARKNVYSNGVRLENASWRTWAKSKHNLGTVSPDSLNWLKDCDVTWLYGPLKTSQRHDITPLSPSSRLETPNSYLDRKPILKKKTTSEIILQHSLSQHTLLRHAGAILRAREAANPDGRPSFPRQSSGISDRDVGFPPYSSSTTNASSSGLSSPSERRHIHFNNEVVQCIAVEVKEPDEDDGDWQALLGNSSSDDTVKQTPPKSLPGPKKTTHGSESRTIAPLPPTTLKYRGDTPQLPTASGIGFWSDTTSTSSPASSMETIRPTKPQANFLLDDDYDDHELDYNWDPKPPLHDSARSRPWFMDPEDEEMDQHLHLTSSGMLMPYNDEHSSHPGIFSKVIDTLNTARDIAHVIWNVGWQS
ncbi:hypothetical protein MAP00_004354 [Monascus purpureus]|nr:hypothetical protein MAP00_004354 [Monascus purpureus]